MKYWKYFVGTIVVLLLVVGGVLTLNHYNKPSKSAESHVVVKKHDSKPKKVKAKSSSKKVSSKPSSESAEESAISGSSDDASAVSSVESRQSLPTPQTPVAAFIQQYGVTPAQWLVQNKGMSIEDALYATPDDQETSGELQSEWAYKQGTHDQMVDDTDSSDDDENYWVNKAREPNADYTLEDGTHIHNDDQGNSYDDDGNIIGKGN